MKKKLIIVVIICLSLFIFRDFMIRQYFISKVEYVDYDEYILIDYLNGKKNKASYVGADSMVVLEYDLDENIECVFTYDYDKRTRYEYNLEEYDINKDGNNGNRPINLNNEHLLDLLKSKSKFNYKGIKNLKSREAYVLELIPSKENRIIMYLDKELLYVLKSEEKFLNTNEDKNILHDYELDLELKHKNLFEEYIN